MLSALLIAGLSLLSPPPGTAHATAAKHEDSAKPKAEDAPKAKEEEPKAKPARRKLVSPAVPEEEKAHGTAPEPGAATAKPAPKPVAKAPKRVAPPLAEAQPAAAGDLRVARLQAENALLRQQLAQAQPQAARDIATPDAALAELLAGNKRFVEGSRVRTLMSMQDADLRTSLAKGQAPFAVIVTCSDSRLADNLIFDQELGRLFTIREAGNSPDTQGLASVEYAVEHLGSKLVVVMGHTRCGAVQAVHDAHGQPLPGNLWSLQSAMTGLLESTPEDPNEDASSHLDHLVRTNAQRQARAVVDRSEIVRDLVAKGKVQVVPAVYNLATGQVTFEPAPSLAVAAKTHH